LLYTKAPVVLAVNSPAEFTLAIVGSDDVQLTLLLFAFAGNTFAIRE
jgi:hypothetical protein